MRFVLDSGGSERELAVALDRDATTIAELLRAVGVEPHDAVWVDGRAVPADHTVAEAAVADGARIQLAAPAQTATLAAAPRRPQPRLAVVAGVAAGDAVALDGTVVVGREAGCGLVLASTTVSGEHCRITSDGRGAITVADLGSTNGTWVDDVLISRGSAPATVGTVIRCGAVTLRIEEPAPDDRPRELDPVRHLGAGGAVAFNRPPRPGARPPAPPVRLPDPPPATRDKPMFSLAALLVPVGLGLVMVLVTSSWRYALFMLLSPVLLLANTMSSRRQHGRDARRASGEHAAGMARFADDLAQGADAERARAWEQLPAIAEVLRRVQSPSTRLWERRPEHEDALRLAAGVGSGAWSPLLTSATGQPASAAHDEALDVLEQHERLTRLPVPVELGGGGVVGIVGERTAGVALARSLVVQACAHHGPADLAVAVVVDDQRRGDWDWTTWLPHVREPGAAGGRRLAAGEAAATALLAELRAAVPADGPGAEAADTNATMLLVLDAPGQLRGRDAAARAVLRGAGGPVAGIVLAETVDQLPAVCDTVIECTSADGEAVLIRPAERTVVDDLMVAGLTASRARGAARRLAGLEDPELVDSAGELPPRVDLLSLLPADVTTPDGMQAAWSATAASSALVTPIGVAEGGPLLLDLVADGPHGLLGGTTGSGKSELLRSLVAGLAATHDPDHLTFVLIDYKGGAAFDACAGFPHVVGLVTDLDEHLGERALRCLEAELSYREVRLRDAGVADLPAWLRLGDEARGAPLPRLLVVIDEFATLKAELPDFVEALVGIAQRGRSLGVHLLLGTQRPSGAVDENVRANANLRVALRMTDTRDSHDVVGTDVAASIPPSLPGRGVLRRGPSDVVAVQTALVTGRSTAAAPPVRVGRVAFGPADLLPATAAGDEDGPSDLERLVAASKALVERSSLPAPRLPWPPPLPERLELALDVAEAGTEVGPVAIGLADVPDEQRQTPAMWDPSAGSMLVYGVVGSGTTSTLASCALAATAASAPDALHLHVLDLGRGELAPLAQLPHCGAVVLGREEERRLRFQRWLLAEADRRRRLDHDVLLAEPFQLVLVDGLDAWLTELDDPTSYDQLEAVTRLFSDAAGLRMGLVGSATRYGSVRQSIAAAVEHRLVHRLADPNVYSGFGLRPREVPTLPPGRAVRPSDGRLLHVATPTDLPAAVAELAARWGTAAARPPATIGVLPASVGWDAVPSPSITGNRWTLPVGLDATSLEPASLELHLGEHVLVAGAPGSGRSGLLGGLAARAAAGGVHVVVVADDRSPLASDGHTLVPPSALEAAIQQAAGGTRPVLIVVDDAERCSDPGPALEALASGDGAPVVVVAAGRPDVVGADYGHWLRRLARSRKGLLLRPTGDTAGDLLGARLPRRAPAAITAGRGWLVGDGEVRFVAAIQDPSTG